MHAITVVLNRCLQDGSGLNGALEATLKLTIEVSALLSAPHPAVAKILEPSVAVARPLKAGIASAAAIMTAAKIGEGSFLPELAGFCSGPLSASNQVRCIVYRQLHT